MMGLAIAIVAEGGCILWLTVCVKALRKSLKTRAAPFYPSPVGRDAHPIGYWLVNVGWSVNVAIYSLAALFVPLIWLASQA